MAGPAGAVDPFFTQYRACHERIVALALSGERAGRLDDPVAACPGWTARAMVAHVAGLAEDWVAGRLDDYGSDAWTAAQLARFDGSPLSSVLAAWAECIEPLAALGPAPQGGTAAMWAYGDAVIHEADLRPTLDPGSRVPADAADIGLKSAIARWRHHLTEAGADPLLIRSPDGKEWPVGAVAELSDPASVTTVEAERYELFRALFGRRSRAQVARWQWSGPADPYLDAGLPDPFRWAEADLID